MHAILQSSMSSNIAEDGTVLLYSQPIVAPLKAFLKKILFACIERNGSYYFLSNGRARGGKVLSSQFNLILNIFSSKLYKIRARLF